MGRLIIAILSLVVFVSATIKPNQKIDRFDMLAEGDTLYGMIKIRVKITATQYRWALVKLPKSWYAEPTKKYVTLFDWHGSGEIGIAEADLAKLTTQGLPNLIRNNLIPDSFRNPRTNQYKEILMIFIQHSVSGAPLATPYMVYARDNTDFFKDRIDQDNVFYSGLSLGARGSSGFFVDGWESELARIRGFVLMSSPAPTGTTTLTQAGGIVEQKKPVYLLWNLADVQSNSIQPWNKKVRDTLNKYNARQVTAYNYTSSPAHGGWIARWNPNERRTVTFMDGISMNVNLFEWMLYYSSDNLPTSHAGADLSITLPTNFVTLYGQTIGTSRQWSQISGPNSASINSPTSDTTTVTGMIAGTYVFRLRASNGSTNADDLVTVIVNPEPTPPVDPNAPKIIIIKPKGFKIVVIEE
ncbi:MAG: PKD domain-containing protein [Agriterribacter sp.]